MRPSNLLRATSEATSSSASRQAQRSRPHTLSLRAVGKIPPPERPRFLLLHDVPKTALPTDVLRALKEARAVGDEFPLSAITSPPVSGPRRASLTKTYHLTTPTPALAADIHRLVSTRPLFGVSSSAARPTAYPRPGFNSISNGDIRQSPRIAFSRADASEWVNALTVKANEEGEGRFVKPDQIEERWILKQGARGRRVIIRGLPGKVSVENVRSLGNGCGVEPGPDGCKRLAPVPRSISSAWVITAESVAMAYNLARKLNMNYFHSSTLGDQYLMRAEVVW